ncbi:MAG TPA: fibronectin type III domain-containing protein, partial [Niastella sp.]|nr:fibronectin type III domain-containing protein [Niastella sp.]
IPAPNGQTTAPLEVPDGFVSYNWVKEGSSTVLSTTRFLNASSAGFYKVQVKEKYGCTTSSSDYSKSFQVVNASGTNSPPAVSALTATTVSKTSIQLKWSQASSTAYNETGFEVYEATASGGPYTLKLKTAPDATSATINTLNSGTAYYYKVRAVNNNAASAVVGPVTTTTLSDKTPPTAPLNLRSGASGRSTIELTWTAATDDVGVTNYDLYINGAKSYAFGKVVKATVYNLLPNTAYTFFLKARDLTGNVSASSNTITASTTSGYLKLDPAMGSNRNNYSVYMNFNVVNPATFPWNNTNVLPSEGTSFGSLKNYASNNSGMKMTIIDNFSGYNPYGMNTGNNSGIYPDNVIRSSYYCDQGQVAKLQFSGLSLNHKYSFIFFGSRSGTGDRTGVYKIGTQQVSLNASNNTTNTVQLDNIMADQNGNVFVEVLLGPTSLYAYLNGLVIRAYSLSTTTTSITASDRTVQTSAGIEEQIVSGQASLYPNPATDQVLVRVPLKTASAGVTIKLTNATGSILNTYQYKNINAGIWQQAIPLNGKASQPGVYFLQLSGLPEGKDQVLKVLKVK